MLTVLASNINAVYFASTISGIVPTPKPTNIINIPPKIEPLLNNIIVSPRKATAMIFPHVPLRALVISVYQEFTSLPPVPANAATPKIVNKAAIFNNIFIHLYNPFYCKN